MGVKLAKALGCHAARLNSHYVYILLFLMVQQVGNSFHTARVGKSFHIPPSFLRMKSCGIDCNSVIALVSH